MPNANRDVIGKYFSGDISGDKLRTEYVRLANKFVEAYRQNKCPASFAFDLYQNRCAEEKVFYDEFRKAILDTAVSLNNSAGEKYVTGPADGGVKGSRPVEGAGENDPFSSVIWAKYTDTRGEEHFTSTRHSCDHTAGEMQKASELMSFPSIEDINCDFANKFMSYLKVYSLRDVSRLTAIASALNMFA